MAGVNKVILIGNLGQDPESDVTQGGNRWTKFSIATSEKGGQGKPDIVTWHNIVCWGRLAEIAQEYLKKGRQVYIEGTIRVSDWIDKTTQQKRYKTEIIARQLQLLGSKDSNGGGGGSYAPVGEPSGGGGFNSYNSDDIELGPPLDFDNDDGLSPGV